MRSMTSLLKLSSIMTGTGAVALAGGVRISSILTETAGQFELSTWPMSFFVMTGTSPLVSLVVLTSSQFTFGVGGDAAVDFAIEVFEDFGAALILPVLGGPDRLSILEDERVGERGVGAGFGVVVVGEMVGGVGGAVGGGSDFGGVVQVHAAV